MDKPEEKCWLCSKESYYEGEDMVKYTVECDTPGGTACPPKQVTMHFGCIMDMDA